MSSLFDWHNSIQYAEDAATRLENEALALRIEAEGLRKMVIPMLREGLQHFEQRYSTK
jgi:hypothetical protein